MTDSPYRAAWTELRGYVAEAVREIETGEGDGQIHAPILLDYMDELKTRYVRGGLTATEYLNTLLNRKD